MRYAFFPFLATALFFIPFLLLKDGFRMPDDSMDWSLFLIIAPLSLIGILGYSAGFARAPSTSLIAPFHYSQMLWGALLGFFIFHDVPGPATVSGSVIIIGAGLLVIWRERVNHVSIATQALDAPVSSAPIHSASSDGEPAREQEAEAAIPPQQAPAF